MKQAALLLVALLISGTTSYKAMTLSIVEPAILKNHFSSGLEFKEIINGHRLRSFEDKIDIHMLKGENTTGCKRFQSEDVGPSFSFFFIIFWSF